MGFGEHFVWLVLAVCFFGPVLLGWCLVVFGWFHVCWCSFVFWGFDYYYIGFGGGVGVLFVCFGVFVFVCGCVGVLVWGVAGFGCRGWCCGFGFVVVLVGGLFGWLVWLFNVILSCFVLFRVWFWGLFGGMGKPPVPVWCGGLSVCWCWCCLLPDGADGGCPGGAGVGCFLDLSCPVRGCGVEVVVVVSGGLDCS